MKKFLLIFSILTAFAVASQAQVGYTSMKTSLTSSVDSVKVAGGTANYLYVAPTLGYKCAVFQSEARRVTAAMAGTCFLQGSLDNSTWYTATYSAGDTMTIANAATSTVKTAVAPTNGLPYRYYRLKWSNTSTADTIYVKAKVNFR